MNLEEAVLEILRHLPVDKQRQLLRFCGIFISKNYSEDSFTDC